VDQINHYKHFLMI